jgi:hydrogenase/urease accessory protein HupE
MGHLGLIMDLWSLMTSPWGLMGLPSLMALGIQMALGSLMALVIQMALCGLMALFRG